MDECIIALHLQNVGNISHSIARAFLTLHIFVEFDNFMNSSLAILLLFGLKMLFEMFGVHLAIK